MTANSFFLRLSSRGGQSLRRFVTLGALLADVDPLHGGAEAFLTLSNLLVMWGFATAASQRQR